MTKKIRPAKETDVTAYLRRLFLKTEQELIREIKRKRSAGYVDYAEVAALERGPENPSGHGGRILGVYSGND